MQTKTAKQLTENIKHHPAVLSLSYPGDHRIPNMSWHHARCQGLVPLLAFEVKGGRNWCIQVLNALKVDRYFE